MMEQYVALLNQVLKTGQSQPDRTGVGTVSLFGTRTAYDLQNGFPLVTTKKMHWKAIVHELLWFISGATNIRYLVQNDVRIWNEWPYQKFQTSPAYDGESITEFANKIAHDATFAQKHGDLGPVYGKQWRDFEGVDQLQNIITLLKTNPHSRRIVMSAWNPPAITQMLLPPCHVMVQFYVHDRKLSCQLYQRSADLFLGAPFNIASYALLTHLLARECDLAVGSLIHVIGDAHIYNNHISQVQTQIQRLPKQLPTLAINTSKKTIFEITFEDIELLDYEHHPHLAGEVAI